MKTSIVRTLILASTLALPVTAFAAPDAPKTDAPKTDAPSTDAPKPVAKVKHKKHGKKKPATPAPTGGTTTK